MSEGKGSVRPDPRWPGRPPGTPPPRRRGATGPLGSPRRWFRGWRGFGIRMSVPGCVSGSMEKVAQAERAQVRFDVVAQHRVDRERVPLAGVPGHLAPHLGDVLGGGRRDLRGHLAFDEAHDAQGFRMGPCAEPGRVLRGVDLRPSARRGRPGSRGDGAGSPGRCAAETRLVVWFAAVVAVLGEAGRLQRRRPFRRAGQCLSRGSRRGWQHWSRSVTCCQTT